MTFKKGHTPWNIGTKGIMKAWNKNKKMTEELYPNYGMRNKKHLKKSKEKMGKSHQGKKPEEESIRKGIETRRKNNKDWHTQKTKKR